jgi:hypothetical protein
MTPYVNRWAGFTLERPQGYEASLVKGMLMVKKDAPGRTAAVYWPQSGPMAASPETLARWFVGVLQSISPGVKVFRAPGPPQADGVLLRVQIDLYGTRVSATYHVRGGGGKGVISGVQAPAESFKAVAPELGAILSSIKPGPSVRRVVFRDPTEGAFAVQIPEGFQARGQIVRQSGMPMIFLEAQVQLPQGLVRCSIPPISFRFTEALGGGFLGKLIGGLNAGLAGMGGGPSEPWMSGAVFARNYLAPRTNRKAFRIESIDERPDLLQILAAETARGGVDPSQCQFTAATARFLWSEGGHDQRERLEVTTTRYPMVSMWGATVNSTVWAPVAAWDEHEPVAAGILDSFEMNPAWQQSQDQANAAANNARMQDIYNRQRQISQTLSETSDIISQGYWGRQAVMDQISHDRSNAMRGVQDVRDSSGQVFNVPNGHDQYWRDSMNNVFGGSWLAQPDPTWQRLEPLR